MTATPIPTMDRPQTTIAEETATPCRSTRETQPENTPPRNAPTGIAAKSTAKARPPSLGPPKSTCAISGTRARGIPKVIATPSRTKDMRSTGWPRR